MTAIYSLSAPDEWGKPTFDVEYCPRLGDEPGCVTFVLTGYSAQSHSYSLELEDLEHLLPALMDHLKKMRAARDPGPV